MPDGENSCPARSIEKSNGAAIFNIDSFHYKKQTIKQ